MENIAPPLSCTMHVRSCFENGLSPYQAIQSYLQSSKNGFSKKLLTWVVQLESKQEANEILDKLALTPHQRALLDIFGLGLKGQPIHQRLVEFETELIEISRREVEKQVQNLSFQLLMPLFLFQVPAFFLLLIGPIFFQLLERLSS